MQILQPLQQPFDAQRSGSTPQLTIQKDFKHYSNIFRSENVKYLLKDLKKSLREAKKSTEATNPTLSTLEFKLAFIRKQQLKAEA